MKPIEELRISPAPWKAVRHFHSVDSAHVICADGYVIGDNGGAGEFTAGTASLIAEAPRMYEVLADVHNEMCGPRYCGAMRGSEFCRGSLDCIFHRIEQILASAAGVQEEAFDV